MALAPSQRPELDPRLLRYLEATEAVLWQGYPKAGSFLPLAQNASVVARILLSVFLYIGAMGLVDGTSASMIAAGGSLLIALFLLAQGWHCRPSRWVYVLTDPRVMSVHGGS